MSRCCLIEAEHYASTAASYQVSTRARENHDYVLQTGCVLLFRMPLPIFRGNMTSTDDRVTESQEYLILRIIHCARAPQRLIPEIFRILIAEAELGFNCTVDVDTLKVFMACCRLVHV